MKFNILSTIMCFLALAASVSARRHHRHRHGHHLKFPKPAPIGPWIPSWHVAIEPGQEDKIVVNGTIQQVDTYMENLYPGWIVKFKNYVASHPNPPRLGPGSLPELMEVKKYKCNHWTHQVLAPPLHKAIRDLQSIGTERHLLNEPNTRICGILSCWEDGAFILCNDSDKTKTLEHFTDLEFAARNLVQKCTIGKRHPRVSGKMFFLAGYSLIARKWDCDHKWPSAGHDAEWPRTGHGSIEH
ncbi:hypothetical protein E4U14_008559 [Claviceps sp. LM454 group G7]|nr:hypothetical protein E4U14_008559 [Claviceps sp. LM454 group G7]